MRRLLYHILSVGLLITSFYSCIEDKDMTPGVRDAGKPVFSDDGAEYVSHTASTIEVKAQILKENGSKITERGFSWMQLPSTLSIQEGGTKVPYNGDEDIIGYYTLTIKGLENGKEYIIYPYAENGVDLEYGREISQSTETGLGSVETIKPTEIYAKSMKTGGEIRSTGEGEIRERGVYYSTVKDSLTKKNAVKDSVISTDESEQYSCQLVELDPSTLYYVQAYVKNNYGIFLGAIDSAETKNGLPEVDKVVVVDTGFTHVALTSFVKCGDDEFVTIKERGFCWSKGAEPTIDSAIVQCGEGYGDFDGTISGLTPGEPYYVCAYAINSLDTVVYGESIRFYTKTDVPTVSIEAVTNIQNGKADVKGAIISEGASPVTASGICWSYSNPKPTLLDNVLPLSTGAGSVFSGQLTGLKGGLMCYVCAYAINDEGTSYSDVVEQFETPPAFDVTLPVFLGSPRLSSSTAYFAIGSNLYLLGGDLGAELTSELWMYSVAGNNWVERKAFKGGPAKWQLALAYGQGAFVYGGLGEDGEEQPQYYYYNANDINLWEDTWGEVPDTSYMTVGYVSGSNLFYIGGKKDTAKSDVWNYQFAFKTWQKKTDFPVKQYGGVAVVLNGVAYVGMGKDDMEVCNGNLWTTPDAGTTWTHVTSCDQYTGGILAGVASSSLGRIYVVDEDYYILEYNPQTDQWAKKSRVPQGYRNIHCMYEVNGKIYIGLGNTANSLTIYDPLWDN